MDNRPGRVLSVKDFEKLIDQNLQMVVPGEGFPLIEDVIAQIIEEYAKELHFTEVVNMAKAIYEINKKNSQKKVEYNKIYKLVHKANDSVKKKKLNAEIIYSDANEHCIYHKGKKVADFSFMPLYMVEINGETRYYYNISYIRNKDGQTEKVVKKIYFTKNLLASTRRDINNHLKHCGADAVFTFDVPSQALVDGFINSHDFRYKESTPHLGIVAKNGKYYVVGPEKVYEVDTGNETDDIEYIPSTTNVGTKDVYTNLCYDPKKFPAIAAHFGRNVYKLNSLMNMAVIVGYIHAAVHEYVFRKDVGNTTFPPLFVIGLPEVGKTSVIKSIMPYCGYAPNTKVMEFSQQSITSIQNDLMSSYNIPRFLDEYGKSGKVSQEEADNLIEAVANKSLRTRSQANLSNFGEEYKNPLVITGQFTPKSPSLLSRSIIIEFKRSYIMNEDGTPTKEGEIAKKAQENLQSAYDANYWVGMAIMQRRLYDNASIRRIYRFYRRHVRKHHSNSNRGAEAIAVIMAGLHCYIKMQRKLGNTNIGFDFSTVLAIPQHVLDSRAGADADDRTELEKFFDSVLGYAKANAGSSVNNSLNAFGEGKFLFVAKANRTQYQVGKMKYQKSYNHSGEEVVYVNVSELCNLLNNYLRGNNTISLDQLRKDIDNQFRYTQDGRSRLVLAPKGYQHKNSRYTIFSKDEFYERFFNVEELEQEIRQLAEMRLHPLMQYMVLVKQDPSNGKYWLHFPKGLPKA